MKFALFLLFVCASLLNSVAQTFEWESAPNGYKCDVHYVKIQETNKGDFFIIGNNDCIAVGCLKLNKFGNLVWKVSPKIFSAGLTDFITFDNSKSYYVIGIGNVSPETSALFQIDENGFFIFEREIYTYNYSTRQFYYKLYRNQLLTCGLKFHAFPIVHPVVEFRSLSGDTLGNREILSKQYLAAQKIFELKDKPGFLLFCAKSEGGYTYITTIQTDTLGNKLSENVYGIGDDGYRTDYRDLIEKDTSYYLLGSLMGNGPQGWQKNGTYIFKFNYNGDSVNLKRIDDNHAGLHCIAPAKDNGFIVAGEALIKLDSNYNIEWRKDFKKGVSITSVAQAADGGYYGAGSFYDESIDRTKMYVFKTDAKGNRDGSTNYPEILIYPNPVKNELRLDLPFGEQFLISVADMQGRKCLDYYTVGSSIADISNLKEGIYLLIIKNSGGEIVKIQKLLKQD